MDEADGVEPRRGARSAARVPPRREWPSKRWRPARRCQRHRRPTRETPAAARVSGDFTSGPSIEQAETVATGPEPPVLIKREDAEAVVGGCGDRRRSRRLPKPSQAPSRSRRPPKPSQGAELGAAKAAEAERQSPTPPAAEPDTEPETELGLEKGGNESRRPHHGVDQQAGAAPIGPDPVDQEEDAEAEPDVAETETETETETESRDGCGGETGPRPAMPAGATGGRAARQRRSPALRW